MGGKRRILSVENPNPNRNPKPIRQVYGVVAENIYAPPYQTYTTPPRTPNPDYMCNTVVSEFFKTKTFL